MPHKHLFDKKLHVKKKKKKKPQKYTKTFFKNSSNTLKNKKHRVKINPTSIFSNLVCVNLVWVNVKSLRTNLTKIPNPASNAQISQPEIQTAVSLPSTS